MVERLGVLERAGSGVAFGGEGGGGGKVGCSPYVHEDSWRLDLFHFETGGAGGCNTRNVRERFLLLSHHLSH